MRTVAVIFNPAAGRGADDRAMIEDRLRPHFAVDFEATCKERDADACARAALAKKPDIVVAVGGDGTVSLVAGVLAGTGVPLGIVPRGTSNSIAAGLGIPTDDEGALGTIASGTPRAVDTALANGRMMVLHASIGFQAATVAGTPRDAKNRWGVLAYLKEGLVNLTDLTEFKVAIETEAEVVRCRAINVTVANVAPAKTVLAQGPAAVTPDDGALDVTIVAAGGLAEAVATGLHLLRSAAFGEAATRDNVGFLTARRLVIETDPVQPLLVDGEPAGSGRLVIACVPRSLEVLVPNESVVDAAPPSTSEKLDGLPDLEVEPKR